MTDDHDEHTAASEFPGESEQARIFSWRNISWAGVLMAVVGFAGSVYYPLYVVGLPWLSFEWDPTEENFLWRLPLLVLNLAMFTGPMIAIVGGLGLFMQRLRRHRRLRQKYLD